MDNYSFDTEENAFRCVECDHRIKVDRIGDSPRSVPCEKCGTVYNVAKSPEGAGMSVEVITRSEPDVISEEEKNLEENDE